MEIKQTTKRKAFQHKGHHAKSRGVQRGSKIKVNFSLRVRVAVGVQKKKKKHCEDCDH
jgi:hypothetical protein